MKVKLFSVLLCAFLGTYAVNGQVDFFNNSEETARRLDSIEGRDTPQRRANRENSTNYDNPNSNNRSSGENDDLREMFEERLGENMGIFMEAMDKFHTQETRCIFIMVVYVAMYQDLIDMTYAANDCKTKSDGYALQALAIGAGNTFMYCPESLSNKTWDEHNRIWDDDMLPVLANEDNNQAIIEWKKKT